MSTPIPPTLPRRDASHTHRAHAPSPLPFLFFTIFLLLFSTHAGEPPRTPHFFVGKTVFPRAHQPPQKAVTRRERDTALYRAAPPPFVWCPLTTHSLSLNCFFVGGRWPSHLPFSLFFFSCVNSPPHHHLSLLCGDIRLQTMCKKATYKTKHDIMRACVFWTRCRAALLLHPPPTPAQPQPPQPPLPRWRP